MSTPIPPSYDEALPPLLESVPVRDATESVPLSVAHGRTLTTSIHADRDQPPFNRSAMDGYALRHAEFAPCMKVAGRIDAGSSQDLTIPPGHCIAIATGAVVPEGLDVVVPHEKTDRRSPVTFDIDGVEAWANIHRRGDDAQRSDTLLQPGTVLRAGEIGIAATMGHAALDVRPCPRVAVVTTGNEVVAVEDTPAPHQIRSGNGPMIDALARRLGASTVACLHARDDMEETTRVLANAVEIADVVITTGGISAGDGDCVPGALESLGCTWTIAGIGMQPGRPVRAGHIGDTSIVCLPGNPVSALVCGVLVLAPVIRTRLGRPAPPRWRPVTLREDTPANTRREAFRPAFRPGPTQASVPRWHGSGDLCHVAGTGGIVRLPVCDVVPAGTTVMWTRWP